jgi:predicted PurR-regulated permease PerM
MKEKFDLYDYLTFFFVLFVSIFIGLYFGLNINQKLKSLFNKSISRKNKTNPAEDELEMKKSDTTVEDDKPIESDKTVEDEMTVESDKTMNFLTANSSMSALPVALSLLATFFSSCKKIKFLIYLNYFFNVFKCSCFCHAR